MDGGAGVALPALPFGGCFLGAIRPRLYARYYFSDHSESCQLCRGMNLPSAYIRLLQYAYYMCKQV